MGDVGPYAKHMFKILTDGVGRIRQALSPAYFQNMCTKLAAVFLDEFLDNIWQLRRVSKTGGGQLLMDLHGVKEYLLKMPNAKLQVKRKLSMYVCMYVRISMIDKVVRMYVCIFLNHGIQCMYVCIYNVYMYVCMCM